MKYVEVAVLAHTKENFDTFTYSLPKGKEASIGQIVEVPFRNRKLHAVVLGIVKKPEFETKEVSKILDKNVSLPKHLIDIAKWISKYYVAPINTVFRTMLPAGFYKKRRARKPEVGIQKPDTKTLTNELQTTNYKLTLDQKTVLSVILNEMKDPVRPKEIRDSFLRQAQDKLPPQNDKKNKPYLLFGVTGSGKTEVYIRLIEENIKKNRGSIVLVPEIALTPQTIQRFEERFPGEVTVVHSHLKETERQKNWNDIKSGNKKIVVGSRSAIFAPYDNLGLIIVDEEHETSYKQENTPRYHVVKVAEKIVEITGAKLILGSATPSIESFYKAEQGKYELLNLPKRIKGDEMPEVSVVDLKKEFKGGNKSIFSLKLQYEIKKALDNDNKQVVLFLNRRGSSTYVFCRDCGHTEKCPHCDIPLVFHGGGWSLVAGKNKENSTNHDLRTTNHLQCHHCDYKKPPPTTCPNCKSPAIKYLGTGTQKVEDEAKALFPKAKVFRMDKDTTAKRGSHDEIYNNFANKNFDILVGTQMIAKGWDLPNVALVGIILADVGLNFPDFRASERTFQLLSQVAGRTGRGNEQGNVIIQTYDPDNFAIATAKNHNYEDFYKEEIKAREKLSYPPFQKLVRLGYENVDPKEAESKSIELSKILNTKFTHIIGPSPSFIPKLRGKYRWQILVKYDGNNSSDIVKLIPKDWSIDIDPQVTI